MKKCPSSQNFNEKKIVRFKKVPDRTIFDFFLTLSAFCKFKTYNFPAQVRGFKITFCFVKKNLRVNKSTVFLIFELRYK